MTEPVLVITMADRRRAKRDRVCAQCRAKLSGSDVGMGYWLCIDCRIARRQAENPDSAA